MESGVTEASSAAGFVSCFMFPAYCEKLHIDLFWWPCIILYALFAEKTEYCGQLDCLVLITLWVREVCKVSYLVLLALITGLL